MSDFKQALISAMSAAGIMDPAQRADIAAIIFAETGFKPRGEASYTHTERRDDRLDARDRCVTRIEARPAGRGLP